MINLNAKKPIFIGAGVLAVAALLLFTTVLYLQNKPVATETEKIATKPVVLPGLDAQRVFIKDFHELDSFIDSESRYGIERRLYINTVMEDPHEHGFDDHGHDSAASSSSEPSGPAHPLDLYTGTIRPGSFSNTTSGNTRTTELLVDIEPANLTYHVLIFKKKNNNYHETTSTIITCASDDLAIDTSAVCRHGAS